MRRTELLQGIRKMKFEEAYEGWNAGRLTQAEAAQILEMCEQFERTVGSDNCVRFDKLILQIPADQHRPLR